MSAAAANATPHRVGPVVVQARLFVVSYAPLFVIFALQSRGRVEQWVFAAAGVVAFALGLRLVAAARMRTARFAELSDIEDRGGQVAGYLASYLLPFITGPPTSWRLWAAYAVYFTVAFVIAARSDTGLINPTLYLFGLRVIAATVRGRRVLVVCTTGAVAPGPHPVFQLMGGAGLVLADRGQNGRTVEEK